MSEKTKIQWCDDTNNFWRICTKVSPGCLNCYAVTATPVRINKEKWGKGAPRIRGTSAFLDPYKWNKKPWVCDQCGTATENREAHFWPRDGRPALCACIGKEFHRRRVFALSLGDWLDDEAPIEYLSDMLEVVYGCQELNWLLVTKRPENWAERLREVAVHQQSNRGDCRHLKNKAWRLCDEWLPWNGLHRYTPPKNIWFGFTAENQECLEKRWEHAKKVPAVQHFISVEPMLEEMDFTGVLAEAKQLGINLWIIFGGESGNNARPCCVDWIRIGLYQCGLFEVPAFVKQLGANPYGYWTSGAELQFPEAGWKLRIKHHKGGDITEWPTDLRVREFPQENR